MSRKMKLGVLYGGISSEREVSINTGKQIINILDEEKYNVVEIFLNKKEDIFKCKGLDFVFIALHGKFGEDGQVQSILDSMGIKYNGSDFSTSSLCMNKYLVKKVLSDYAVQMPRGIIVDKKYDLCNIDLTFPIIVKPNFGGSSVGIVKCETMDELLKNVKESFGYDDKLLIEEFIEGQEITCGILNGEALPIFKIIPQNHEFFNYISKYDNTSIEEPIELSEDLDRMIKEISKKCYDVLNCRIYSRIDFILKDGIPYFLEINTLPGMTEGSLFPKMGRLAGLDFKSLVDNIIESSIN
ncbi:D-alanine--D-alanine ligase [Candidatus Arthromitus sp. SFB-rat-Yit]|uniref:D-alanine--D-alanine ligase n=1 Tax=Candidatus Arthromitus sp. SFB-rat-Yit TaxID=1041504 RepID=UPI000227A68E|nr:D-alanine--D-alanine ligase [Candidatus Arthromitus sp. SFB-rat-Yit]BAK81696.1 D-alanine--D-alanine ligase [Candidatus Arthromitus sp. SFB-rat-Yit]